MDIFLCDEDRRAYLGFLKSQGKRYGLTFWCWCLMSNHVHLVAVPLTEDALARGIGEAHRRYTCRFNEREQVKGHLFQERFYSYPIQSDRHLLAVISYVLRNPVDAGVVDRPEKYRWSSASALVDETSDPLADTSSIAEMVSSWREVLEDGMRYATSVKRIEKHMRTGRPFGGDSWIESLQAATGRQLRPRKRGRPRKCR